MGININFDGHRCVKYFKDKIFRRNTPEISSEVSGTQNGKTSADAPMYKVKFTERTYEIEGYQKNSLTIADMQDIASKINVLANRCDHNN